MPDKEPKWDLNKALVLIRSLQPGCNERGYYVALGGGVLNNGYSDHDLDLLLMPMTLQSDPEALNVYIHELFGRSVITKVTSAWHYEFPHRKLEITVVDVVFQQLTRRDSIWDHNTDTPSM